MTLGSGSGGDLGDVRTHFTADTSGLEEGVQTFTRGMTQVEDTLARLAALPGVSPQIVAMLQQMGEVSIDEDFARGLEEGVAAAEALRPVLERNQEVMEELAEVTLENQLDEYEKLQILLGESAEEAKRLTDVLRQQPGGDVGGYIENSRQLVQQLGRQRQVMEQVGDTTATLGQRVGALGVAWRALRGSVQGASGAMSAGTQAAQALSFAVGGLGKLLIGAAAAFVAVKGAQAAWDLGALGAQLEAQDRAFGRAFGSMSSEMESFNKNWSDMVGRTEREGGALLAQSARMAIGFGASTQAASEQAQQIATLAGDIAAFNGILGQTDSVMTAVQYALQGNTESLRRFGISISAGEVSGRALADTGKRLVTELTAQERATAALAIVQEQAAHTVGALAAEQGEASTRVAQFGAQFRELKEELATGILPLMESLFDIVEAFMPILQALTAAWSALWSVLGPILEGASNLLGEILDTTTRWLKTVTFGLVDLTGGAAAAAVEIETLSSQLHDAYDAGEDVVAAFERITGQDVANPEAAQQLADIITEYLRLDEAAKRMAENAGIASEAVGLTEVEAGGLRQVVSQLLAMKLINPTAFAAAHQGIIQLSSDWDDVGKAAREAALDQLAATNLEFGITRSMDQVGELIADMDALTRSGKEIPKEMSQSLAQGMLELVTMVGQAGDGMDEWPAKSLALLDSLEQAGVADPEWLAPYREQLEGLIPVAEAFAGVFDDMATSPENIAQAEATLAVNKLLIEAGIAEIRLTNEEIAGQWLAQRSTQAFQATSGTGQFPMPSPQVDAAATKRAVDTAMEVLREKWTERITSGGELFFGAEFDVEGTLANLDTAAIEEIPALIADILIKLPEHAIRDPLVAELDAALNETSVDVTGGDAVKSFAGVGAAISAGVASIAGDLATTLAGRVNRAIGAAQAIVEDLWDIDSPSEVWAYYIGRPLGEGIAKGIDDSIPAIVEAASGAISAAQNALDYQLAGFRLEDAHKRLDELVERRSELQTEIETDEGFGRGITANEQVGIETAQRNAFLATFALAQGSITQAEWQVAQDAVDEVTTAATEGAEEIADLDRDIERAEIGILQAELGIVGSFLRMVESGAGWTAEMGEVFAQVAGLAGLPETAIANLIGIMESLPSIAQDVSSQLSGVTFAVGAGAGGSGGGGSGGGGGGGGGSGAGTSTPTDYNPDVGLDTTGGTLTIHVTSNEDALSKVIADMIHVGNNTGM